MRKAYVILIGLVLIGSARLYGQEKYSGGTGQPDDPWQIADKDDLLELAAATGDYGAYFILTADIDLAGETFTSAVIADDPDPEDFFDGTEFTGVFNGNDHVIRNLTITAGAGSDFLGLFGYLGTWAEIKNLGLENVAITGGDGSLYNGALLGVNSIGTLSQCYATGAVTVGNAAENIGGLVGANAGTIQDCYADPNVTGGTGSQVLGGLVGLNIGITSECYAAGSVTGTSSVGGFIGSNNTGTISHCYFLHPDDGGGPINGWGNPLTNVQMQDQINFTGWDFFAEAPNGTDEIWQMGNYPVLGWQVPVGLREFAALAQFWLTDDCPEGTLCATVNWFEDSSINEKDLRQLAVSWLQSRVQTDYPGIEDGFETGDFTALPWVHAGDADWVIDPNIMFEGSYAAQSGEISHSQASSLELTVDTTGFDDIVFYLKVSSEEDYDFLYFYIDDVPQPGLFSGDMDWTELTYDVDPGTHTFKWKYAKDGSATHGKDCAWIDNVKFIRRNE